MAEQSFLDHLEELRSTLIRCIVAILILLLPAFLVSPYVIEGIIAWSCPPEMQSFNYFAPFEVLILQFKLAFILSLAVAFPYVLWQGWKFILPALYDNERKALKIWVSVSSLLFILGATFCFILILPLIMQFSQSFSSDLLKPVIGISSFLTLAGWLMFAFGAMFQFPLAVMIAIRFGFVKKATLKRQRPYVFLTVLIVAGILTPPDVISQVMLAVPTYLLFELGLFFSKEERNEKA